MRKPSQAARAKSKVAWLAHHAWGDRERGPWPDLIPAARRNEYSLAEIKHWLEVFLFRFFALSDVSLTLPCGQIMGLVGESG